ncbi:DDT domain-containing protein DDR4 isoform X2 [Tasmannia lanceolata]|uniref:DDT domain-containing protein DDR4 isoform X2 n=1 Tax=Tasmannia lanceolata TaxID=3420 RepID=UPI004063D54C
MAEKRGRGKPKGEEGFVKCLSDENGSMISVQISRLRARWELASVLNFLHVFQPVIQTRLEISAEEIETALILPNTTLAQLHIALLKGIPPVSKSLTDSDVWVTVLCKKLSEWWSWVAEGEFPLIVAHGEEVSRYKELDPAIRLLILKALCEIRADQDDTLRYIDDALKNKIQISTFRKDRIAGDEHGTSYWYDGDSILGHRLYVETKKVEFNPKLKGKGRLGQPAVSIEWQTLATNLGEFQEISDKLSCSKIIVEAEVGKILKNDIIPVIEELQKKKERALKRKQRQAMLLDSFLTSYGSGNSRSRRGRGPVSYTFDEYDRSIDEAIQLIKLRCSRKYLKEA